MIKKHISNHEGHRRPRGVICFTNPAQFQYIYQAGVYGNVSSGDVPQTASTQSKARARITRFGKLKDLLSVTAGDFVFLFEREQSRLHGVWTASGEPFFCSSPVFDPSNAYPYRLNLNHFLNFQTPVPAMELRKLLNKNLFWSIRTFERELNATFASINPISIQETQALLELFWKYNHRGDPRNDLITYQHIPFKSSVNFHDMVATDMYISENPLQITADNFGSLKAGQVYEEALHCYLIYNLVRQSSTMREVFGPYTEVLREVPISVAGQARPDLLLIYRSGMTDKPTVYSVIEVKKRSVTQGMLGQLLEYIRLFSERHALDLNSVEGIYIGESFEDKALEYVEKRNIVEVERPLKLFQFSLSGNNLSLMPVS